METDRLIGDGVDLSAPRCRLLSSLSSDPLWPVYPASLRFLSDLETVSILRGLATQVGWGVYAAGIALCR
jgi:hypothetical protein